MARFGPVAFHDDGPLSDPAAGRNPPARGETVMFGQRPGAMIDRH
jgi:hypothetical protein